jgi:hypothetical protein
VRSSRGGSELDDPFHGPAPSLRARRVRRRGLGITQLVQQLLASQRRRDTLGVIDGSAVVGGDGNACHGGKRTRTHGTTTLAPGETARSHGSELAGTLLA